MWYVNARTRRENESEHHHAMKYGIDEETKVNFWILRVVSNLFISECFVGVK